MLPNPADCATDAEIRTMSLEFSRIKTSYDPSDKEDPVKYHPTFSEGY
jgi:hypothetical protein